MSTPVMAFGAAYATWLLICAIEEIRYRRGRRARAVAAAKRRHPSAQPAVAGGAR